MMHICATYINLYMHFKVCFYWDLLERLVSAFLDNEKGLSELLSYFVGNQIKREISKFSLQRSLSALLDRNMPLYVYLITSAGYQVHHFFLTRVHKKNI